MTKTGCFLLAALYLQATVLAQDMVDPSSVGCGASPGLVTPEVCSGGFLAGNEWDNDEIECNFDGVQLKCDLDEDILSDDDVECQLEVPGDDIEFKCNVDSNCNIDCKDAKLSTIIPASYLKTVEEILSLWKPTD